MLVKNILKEVSFLMPGFFCINKLNSIYPNFRINLIHDLSFNIFKMAIFNMVGINKGEISGGFLQFAI